MVIALKLGSGQAKLLTLAIWLLSLPTSSVFPSVIILSSHHAPFAGHLFLIFHSGEMTTSAAMNTLGCATVCIDVKMVRNFWKMKWNYL